MWKDQLNILQKLSLKRILNISLLYGSYFLAKYFKRFMVRGMPYAASIEPTTACNLGCPECPSGLKQFTRPTGKLDLDLHRKMLDELGSQLFYINYYFQGEPFLHPQFLSLIKEANQRKIYTATSTNAHFINENTAEKIVNSGLDRLIISIDGLSQETYEQYRRKGELTKVIKGTKHLIAAKEKLNRTTPHLIFQFLVVKPNEHEVDDVFLLGKQLGVDEVRLKTAQLYDYKNGNPLMPSNEKYARYKRQKDGTYKSKYTIQDHCWRMWSSTVLTWDGKIVPCCFDKDAKHVLGTLGNSTSFTDIWYDQRYQNFRKQVFTDRSQIDICKNCSEGAKVWT
ncbi:radical SAM protein [Brumimicrobium salinarum]|uniref:Radical SAM protein n=2 Tax=Brumimicrobium salinarum TaxID=2058658 RepID=A0A2I0R6T6_9FLAO|nr:radical SAM protein [Brumimicrobium salinarum]